MPFPIRPGENRPIAEMTLRSETIRLRRIRRRRCRGGRRGRDGGSTLAANTITILRRFARESTESRPTRTGSPRYLARRIRMPATLCERTGEISTDSLWKVGSAPAAFEDYSFGKNLMLRVCYFALISLVLNSLRIVCP